MAIDLDLLQGKNLNLAAEEDDVTVEIGVDICYVTELTENNLTCVPPNKQPSPTVPGGTYPEVNVRDSKPLTHLHRGNSSTTTLLTGLFPMAVCLAILLLLSFIDIPVFNAKLKILIICSILWCLIWVWTVGQLPFSGSTDYNG